jgi:AbrB family looped-hinge helix DNA binding protein
MRTTIDAAGRLVVPKPLRDRLHLRAGAAVEVDERDGVIEIRPVPAEVRIVAGEGGPTATATEPVPVLTDEVVRDTLERVRR